MIVRVADRNVECSSILGSRDCSLVNVVHECSISSAPQQGESMKACRSYCEHGSWIYGSSITSREVERFLTTAKIHSSQEVEILANARIRESSSKLLIIVGYLQLVGGFLFHTWISNNDRDSYNTPKIDLKLKFTKEIKTI